METGTEMEILIQGIGGIGGIISSAMISNGYDPVLITSNKNITENIQQNGIRTKMDGDTIIVETDRIYTELNEVPKHMKFDIIFLIMKANHVEDAARRSLPFLKENGYMVTFQNGVVEDKIIEIVGSSTKVVSAIVVWGGTMIEPGFYEKTSGGDIHIGELTGEITDRIQNLKKLLETSSPVEISTNIRGALWSKLAINSCITTIGAITNQKLGEMLKDKRLRKVFLNTYREVVDTANALNITLEKLAANPYLLYVSEDAGWFKRLYKDIVLRIVGFKYRNIKPSALQSIERGRKTEIEFLNGYVITKAEEVGVEIPYNRKIVDLLREIENGQRESSTDNIPDLVKLNE